MQTLSMTHMQNKMEQSIDSIYYGMFNYNFNQSRGGKITVYV